MLALKQSCKLYFFNIVLWTLYIQRSNARHWNYSYDSYPIKNGTFYPHEPFKILPWDMRASSRELQPKKVLCEILSLICLKQQLSTLKEMNCCLMINRCENCSTERRTSHPRSSNFNSSLWIPCELEFRHCTAIADPFKKHLYIYFVLNICVVMHEMCRLCVRQYTPHLSTPAPL